MITSSAAGFAARIRIGEVLQSTLYDLLALVEVVRQARWNVIGPAFEPMHKYLGDLIAVLDTFVSEVAQSIVSLGFPTSGQASAITSYARVRQIPPGFVQDIQLAQLIADRIDDFVFFCGQSSEMLSELDLGRAARLRHYSAELKKRLKALPCVAQAA